MKNIRDDVELDEFNSLSQIEKELLYKIHMKDNKSTFGSPFEYIVATFKPKYSYEEITKGLRDLRSKGYLRQVSFYATTFGYLEYSDDMEEMFGG